ncbi:DEAD/DEAH box helicase [Rhizobium sp. MHM7A]|uniref:DEAD/DEAH box helicase n=1 Tax=Rhizobium sp. MHM7A TaxID=2583233 RepID=UPI001485D3A3|nr:DEAD/DEAH box helicase [Rhizobium sp. MHM7A]
MNASHKIKLDFVKLFSDKAGQPFSTFAKVKTAIDGLRYPEQRGAAFEAFSTAILATDPKLQVEHIYRVADAPSTLLQSLGIVDEADNGIDRIIVDKIGRVIAVQQKFHLKPEQNVVYSDLPTFFQQATNVSHHLIATTAVSVNLGNKVVKNLSMAEKNTMTVMGLDAHMDLRKDHIARAVEWLAGKVKTPGSRFQPKPHQLTAISDVTKWLKKNDRAIHHSACGTGKTLSSILMAEEVLSKGGTVLVMEPTLTLIKQNLAVWASEIAASGRPVSFLVACSDETVASTGIDDISKSEVGFPVTTHDAAVSNFLKQKRRPGELRVVFSTYHSSDVIEKALKSAKFRFDLGIFDEAHRMVVSQVQNDVISNFSRPLFDENIPIRKRLFQTATLKNIQLKGYVPPDRDVEFVSMDNEALFGQVAHSYSFGQAADAGVIRRVKLLVVQIDVNDLPVDLNSLRVQLERAEVNGHMAAHIASLKKAVAECGARKIISFHGSKKSAEVFADLSREALQDFQTGVVHSGQRATTRAKNVKLLEGTKPALVTNVRCLTEGMDAPATDLVALLAEVKSEIDITQIIGRCVRMPKNPVSDHGHVLLPLVISNTEDMSRERLADIPGMKTYREVFKVLLALDPEFQSAYLTFRKAKASKDPKPTEDARAVLDQHIGFINFSGDELADLIRVSSIDPIEGNFWDHFALLEAASQTHGLNQVNKLFVTECGVRLGLWLANQKTFMLSGKMDEKRENALRKLGINPTSNESRFGAGLSWLQAFSEKHGHCKVPAHGEYHKLRVWLDSRRRDLNRGSLSEERKNAIEACGFSFDVKKDQRFEEGYPHLLAYFAANGHSNVPHRFINEEGFELGRFVTGYLRDKATQARLSVKEMAKLEAVNFKKDGREYRLVDALENKYAQLKTIYDEFGTIKLSKSDMARFKRYKGNLAAVRSALRENRVNDDLRARLASLGLVQPVDLKAVRARMSARSKRNKPNNTASFNEFIRLLKSYIKNGGSPNVPQNGPLSMFKGVHLGGRLNSWLKAWRDDELSDKQIATLQGLGVVKYRKAPKATKQSRKAA